jgi:hypothetical protein
VSSSFDFPAPFINDTPLHIYAHAKILCVKLLEARISMLISILFTFPLIKTESIIRGKHLTIKR